MDIFLGFIRAFASEKNGEMGGGTIKMEKMAWRLFV
jgi:hypothetical protein